MDDLRKTQLLLTDMLKVFHDICIEHSLRYYAIGGTALGAARHQGFIPWDDDIDIGMPRPDYEQFIRIFNKEQKNKRYILESCRSSDPLYLYPYSKIYDTQTTLIEIVQKPIKRGIFLDIFPLDGAGNNKQDSARLAKKIDFWLNLKNLTSVSLKDKKKRSLLKKLAILFFSKGTRLLFPYEYTRNKIDSLCQTFDYEGSEIITNYSGAYRDKEFVKKSFFGKPKLYPYETIQIYCPEDLDSYLTKIYGDWKNPPPKEKQIAHHSYFLDLNHSYLDGNTSSN